MQAPAANMEYGKALHAACAAGAELVAAPVMIELERCGALPPLQQLQQQQQQQQQPTNANKYEIYRPLGAQCRPIP